MKCLVIMHNALNNRTNNGKTVLSILSQFSQNNLMQIYITKLDSSEPMCSSSFLISERDLLNRLARRKNIVSTPNVNNTLTINKKNKIMENLSRTGIVLELRNLLWRNHRWNSRELELWIEKISPDIIFLLPGYLEGIMDCALFYAKKLNVPLVTFVTDDYFSNEINTLDFLKKRLYKKLFFKYSELSEYAGLHYVIGEKMAEKYDHIFNKEHIPLMNSVEIPDKIKENNYCVEKTKFLFAGNCGIGREKILDRLARNIDKMNRKYKLNASLDIYTPLPLNLNTVKKLEKNCCCTYKGSVFGKKLEKIVDEANVLVHVESFDKKYKNLLETAISTKIPEYMRSGKEILVVGPSYSASVDYIFRHKIGSCITEKDIKSIPEILHKMLINTELQKNHREKAYYFVQKYHSKERNAMEVYSKMEELVLSNKKRLAYGD